MVPFSSAQVGNFYSALDMQARCQPNFLLYERNTSGGVAGRGSFVSTIGISGNEVTHLNTGETCPLF